MKLLFILYLIKNENKISKNLDITNENSFDLEKQKKKYQISYSILRIFANDLYFSNIPLLDPIQKNNRNRTNVHGTSNCWPFKIRKKTITRNCYKQHDYPCLCKTDKDATKHYNVRRISGLIKL